MKKQILFLWLICSIIYVNGQLTVTDHVDEVVADGDTVYVAFDSENGDYEIHWHVHSETSGNLIYQVLSVNQAEGVKTAFCVGDNCYFPNYFLPSNPEPQGTDNISVLKHYYSPNGSAEDAYINFKIHTENDPEILTTFTICYSITTGFEESMSDKRFELYPNPTSNYLNIEVNSQLSNQCKIYNIVGKLEDVPFSTIGINKQKYDVSSLKQGVYFIKIGDLVQKFYVAD